MTRHLPFNSPFFLGFDEIERVMDRVAKHGQDGYPPYNIEQLGDGSLRIIIAVAGFTRDDLSVTLEDNQLVVRGKQTDDTERTYLHRGIAARQFQRSFVLADGIEIAGAGLENGLLSIELKRPRPTVAVKTIEISAKGGKGGDKKAAPEIELSAEDAAE
ncbi:MAG: Hsp20 family protein [Alphaproteobacteria bacterium]|nr:MAG: Hsp20 family protein [Alphaproteobacteria bacterium]